MNCPFCQDKKTDFFRNFLYFFVFCKYSCISKHPPLSGQKKPQGGQNFLQIVSRGFLCFYGVFLIFPAVLPFRKG